MRVAYVISFLGKGGPVNVLYDIVSNLAERYDCAVFTLASEQTGDTRPSRKSEFEALGCEVFCVCESRAQSLLCGKSLLSRALDKWRPDVVHSHGYRATVLAQGLHYPLVDTVHNCIFDDFKTSYPLLQAYFMARSEVSALRLYDAVVACSESNARFLREEYGLDAIAIRNGVDQTRFFPLPTEKDRVELRAELGLPARCKTLTTSGSCSERKGTLPLAVAFSGAFPDSRDAELYALGKGPALEECRALGLPNAHFPGFVSDPVPWLQASDLYVSASRSEGMPLAVLEGISCGLPALLSDIPAHREIAAALDGQNCVRIFDAQSQESMAKAIREAVCGPTALSRPQDVSCFSSKAMAEGYMRVYERVISIGAGRL